MKKLTIIYFFIILINYTNNSFQLSIFTSLNKQKRNKNISISPLSIFQSFVLLANGANNETREEILKLLDDKELDEINIIYLKIISILKETSSLDISNIIMSRLSPIPDFIKLVKQSNFTQIRPLKNIKQINNLCEYTTNGKIKELFYELDDNTFMIILNLIQFKAYWTNPFFKELTSKRFFYNDKQIENVNMMRISGYFSYFEDSNIQVIKLNFLSEAIYSLIILPKKNIKINEFINMLENNNEYLYTIYDNLKPTNINLEIPKFEIRYEKI